MRFASEIQGADTLEIPERPKVSAKELALARQLVDTLAGPFEPQQYHDTYTEALRNVIEARIAGKKVTAPKAARPPKVVDLVDALRQSLKTPRGRPREKKAA
jgi:DNA end-binding protein Ku